MILIFVFFTKNWYVTNQLFLHDYACLKYEQAFGILLDKRPYSRSYKLGGFLLKYLVLYMMSEC